MIIGSNSCWDFVKDIRISLHLSVFSSTLSSSDHCITLSVVRWALLSSPFATVSEIVASSTYFKKVSIFKYKVINRNKKSQGPDLVHWGTPEGTDPQQDTHPSASLIPWDLFAREPITCFVKENKTSLLVRKKKISTHKTIWNFTGSQCSACGTGVIWQYLSVWVISRAAEFWRRCNLEKHTAGTPYWRPLW